MVITYSSFYRNHTIFFCDQEQLLIQGVSGGNVNILGGHSIGHSKQKLCMYKCHIANGFWYRAISLYSCKIVDKEILRIFLISVFIVQVKKKLLQKWYTRRTARSLNRCYHQHKGTSRRTQTSNTSMSSHELQSALMLTVEVSKMYCTR
jgi:hypothetical protein